MSANPFDDAAAAFAEPAPKPKAEPSAGAAKEKKRPAIGKSEREAQEAAWQAQADALKDGVHFGLPMEVYLRIRALGASSLGDIDISPATFWARSWLNPNPPQLTEEQAKRKEAIRTLGSAYHCARLEPEAFEERYIRQLDKEDFADQADEACWTGTDIGEALAELGQAKKKAGESVLEQAQRLRDAGFEGLIWPLALAEWEEARGERIPLSPMDWDAIQVDMDRIHSNKRIAALLSDGEPEVTIIWTDEHGLRCKCRPDYLRAESWADFKTFANPNGKRLAQALADAVRFNRYHMTAAHYRDGIEALRVGGLQLQGEASEAQKDLVAAIQLRPEELEFHFIFQEKGGIPNLLARRFIFWDIPLTTEKIDDTGASPEAVAKVHEAQRRRTGIFIKGQQDIDRAKRDFALYAQVYAPGEPWAPIEPMGEFSDLDFNNYWLEGRYDF